MGMLSEIFSLYAQRTDFFIKLLYEHFYLSSIAVGISATIGIVVGILMTRFTVFRIIMLQLTSFLYTIPSISLFGILVALSGIGVKSAIIALVVYGLLPIIRNTYVGINEVDPLIKEAAQAMGSTKWQLLTRVELPLALPVIFAGFRTMTVMIIALAGIASFIGAGGLGVAIWRGITTNFPAMTLGGSLLVALTAITVDTILGFIERYMQRRFSATTSQQTSSPQTIAT